MFPRPIFDRFAQLSRDTALAPVRDYIQPLDKSDRRRLAAIGKVTQISFGESYGLSAIADDEGGGPITVQHLSGFARQHFQCAARPQGMAQRRPLRHIRLSASGYLHA